MEQAEIASLPPPPPSAERQQESPAPAGSEGGTEDATARALVRVLADFDNLRGRDDNPEREPFKYKYAARDLLEKAMKEEKLDTGDEIVMARVNYRFGALALEVEEPHIAEEKLSQAAEAMYPGLVAAILEASGDEIGQERDASEGEGALDKEQQQKEEEASIEKRETREAKALEAKPSLAAKLIPEETMDTLNQLGILWVQRECPRKGLLFLQAADRHFNYVASAAAAAPAQEEEETPPPSGKKALRSEAVLAPSASVDGEAGGGAVDAEATVGVAAATVERPGEASACDSHACMPKMRSLQTHTFFYLAQVYGQLRDVEKASRYCYLTLQRQLLLSAGTAGEATPNLCFNPLEWSKNACFLADFYMGRNDFATAGHCLAASRAVLRLLGRREGEGTGKGGAEVDSGKGMSESESESESEGKDKGSSGSASTGEHSDGDDEEYLERWADVQRRLGRLYVIIMQVKHEEKMLQENGMSPEEARALLAGAGAGGAGHGFGPGSGSGSAVGEERVRFTGLEIEDPPLTDLSTIEADFESMRELFKKANGHLETAKGFFVLDGYVSDHVRLLQDVSRAYKYLLGFEEDAKRQTAMLSRRATALHPILKVLGKKAYGDLVKELAFELGEVYMRLSELKEASLEEKRKIKGKAPTAGIEKLDQLLGDAIDCFREFSGMYEGEGGDEVERETVGPYLRSHFHVARLLGRRENTAKTMEEAVEALGRSLKEYEWVVEHAPKVTGDEEAHKAVFAAELDIAKQMKELLPHKIARASSASRR